MQNQNSIKTHCPKGHEYTEENTYISSKNQRICRTCAYLRNKKKTGFCAWSGCKKQSENYYCEEHKIMDHNKKLSYYARNKEMVNAANKERRRAVIDRFFEMYGNICNCCQEDTREFLALDHILGGGNIHRKERTSDGVYRDAIKEHQPNLYQTLCHNCNHAKHVYGVCPHQVKNVYKSKK